MHKTRNALSDRAVLICLLALAAATLFHHAHNAEFLGEYPNMPAWLSRTSVYIAWLGATTIGVAGHVLLRRGYRGAGLALLAAYGCYGLDALLHYARAPIQVHSIAMNASIWLEVVTAIALLAVVAKRAFPRG